MMDIVDRLMILLSCVDKDDDEMRGARETIEDAVDKIERLREALQELVDWQNGPPLVTYTDGWNKAMEKARAALKEGE